VLWCSVVVDVVQYGDTMLKLQKQAWQLGIKGFRNCTAVRLQQRLVTWQLQQQQQAGCDNWQDSSLVWLLVQALQSQNPPRTPTYTHI